MEQKENRKIRYTKMVIRDSLMKLMESKPILNISIKDICELADISRSTFYSHYKDQFDLLRQIQEETFTYFEDIFNKYKDKYNKKETYQMLEEILTYVANNHNSIQVLLSENGDIDFQKKLIYHFTIHKLLPKFYSDKQLDEETKNYFSVFVVHGSVGLISHWLKTGMSIPVQQLAKILLKWTE